MAARYATKHREPLAGWCAATQKSLSETSGTIRQARRSGSRDILPENNLLERRRCVLTVYFAKSFYGQLWYVGGSIPISSRLYRDLRVSEL